MQKYTKQVIRIEGDFSINKQGDFLIDERILEDKDYVHLSIRALKQIIKDAKENLI